MSKSPSKEKRVRAWAVMPLEGKKPLGIYLKKIAAEETAAQYGAEWWKVVPCYVVIKTPL